MKLLVLLYVSASLGTAEVIFQLCQSAREATRRYNGVLLDGQPMNIQLAVSDHTLPAQHQPQPMNKVSDQSGSGFAFVSSGRRGRGGRTQQVKGGHRGRGSKWPKEVPTAKELDQELEAYRQAAPPAATGVTEMELN